MKKNNTEKWEPKQPVSQPGKRTEVTSRKRQTEEDELEHDEYVDAEEVDEEEDEESEDDTEEDLPKVLKARPRPGIASKNSAAFIKGKPKKK